jgi:hypothetical protein
LYLGQGFLSVNAILTFGVKMSGNSGAEPNGALADSGPAVARQDDAIYQNEAPVAKTVEVELDLEAGEIRFGELYESDPLLLPDECEYKNYRILIRKVAFATRLDKDAPHKGRVLRGVVAEILGHKEQ